MTKPHAIITAPCRRCKNDTRHEIIHSHTEYGDDNYDYRQHHQIIQCLGCLQNSFRVNFQDYEAAYPISDDEWDVPEHNYYYPKFDRDNLGIGETRQIPGIVHEIYRETLLAIQEDALTLAGLGLRGTIEAICNERNITGRTLETRISKLATQGMISAKDAERLHGIRFLGNDAAHEIKKPNKDQVAVAFKIINHLIHSVYLLELAANGTLDTLITQLNELKILISKHVKSFNKGDEIPIAKILGKDMRRLGSLTSNLEAQLISEINVGTYTPLSLGKIDTYAGSAHTVQHFIVN